VATYRAASSLPKSISKLWDALGARFKAQQDRALVEITKLSRLYEDTHNGFVERLEDAGAGVDAAIPSSRPVSRRALCGTPMIKTKEDDPRLHQPQDDSNGFQKEDGRAPLLDDIVNLAATISSHTQPDRVDSAKTVQDLLEFSRELSANAVEETKDRHGVEERSALSTRGLDRPLGHKPAVVQE
jgi:hypothetical protein